MKYSKVLAWIRRINPHFFRSGIGFGGSCFPKDIHALIAFAESQAIDTKILKAVLKTNDDQPQKLIALLKKHLDIQGKKIGSPWGCHLNRIPMISGRAGRFRLLPSFSQHGAEVIAYDPLAIPGFSVLFPNIHYADTARGVFTSDAIIIITEWPEFSRLDYSGKIVIDGRRILKAKREAAVYEGVCW